MRSLLIAAGASSLLALSAAQAFSQDGAVTRDEVGQIVRDYLLENPEILIEMQTILEARQKQEQQAAQEEIIAQSSTTLFDSGYDGIVGNPDGDVTVVEFFDYNCGYCKRALADMEALVEENPNLRFVLKEFPILGPDSQKAHIVSMAFRKLMPEKYGEFHAQLLGSTGRADEASAIQIAVGLGADEAALREAMKDDAILAAISETYELANKLQITGTPSYVVGKELVFGAQGKDALSEKIKTATQ
ncbi:DsbA family protein [Nitratireductor thuwali]|uniref:Disulfide bond formation protein D n=1 Tax=Nitratireductor thuwali TaxID=2267699 RepID=A0ABY5MQ25_9HYPH|nr:Disulfide bond formation protein D [Nitratireductor thuwali]